MTTIPARPSPEPSTRLPRSRSAKWFGRIAIILLICAIGWFYAWTALPPQRGARVAKDLHDYYDLLCRGFMKGHLYLDTPVDPTLATMADPWDPVARAGRGLHDATYFNNKYYLYFGVTPELLLFLPFHLVTHTYISESCASVLFSFLGFIFSVCLVRELAKKYLPPISFLMWVGSIAALGLATMVPSLLRRPSVWEVPITCAYACAMLTLFSLAKAVHSRWRTFWLALASLAMGLTVGARPVYIFACVVLLVPLYYWAREFGGLVDCWKKRQWWNLVLAAIIPVALCGFGLALYNYQRFGSPTEFGQRYQMAGDEVSKLKLFSWSYPWYGFRIYMLEPAGHTPYFAFFTVISQPPAPAGHLGMEDPYGVLPNIPFVFLGLGLVGLYRRRPVENQLTSLRLIVACTAVVAALTELTVMSFGGLTNRYMVDFVPALIVLAVVEMMFLGTRPWFRGPTRWFGGLGIAVLLLFSVAFNILVSLSHNEQMRAEDPALYARIAHRANYISYWWDQLTHVKYGPIEMKVVFPRGQAGQLECLLATGTSFRSDYIYAHYLSDDSVQFGFEHTSRGGALGSVVHFKPDETQTIKIDLGSLYPPAAHPFFDHLKPGQAHLLQRMLQVTLNGETCLEGIKECYDATSHVPSIGSSGGRGGFTRAFSGKMVSWRRLPEALPVPAPIQYGPVRLIMKLPAFTGERSEPLVCSGRSGAGDLVFIRYLNDHQVYFGHDNWGGGGRNSEPVNIDYQATHTVDVDYGALYPAAGAADWSGPAERDRVIVKLDGKVVLNASAPFFHPSSPDDIVVGNNPILASSAYPAFTGSLIKADRLSAPLSSSSNH